LSLLLAARAGLLKQRRHVGPELLPLRPLAGGQRGERRLVAHARDVGVLLPVTERLPHRRLRLGRGVAVGGRRAAGHPAARARLPVAAVTFLSLGAFAQAWHAAVGRAQAWAWWASGIVLGAAVLTLFALFEKRRNDVLRVLDALRRRWR
jgi:hypothetical protein